MDLSIVIPCYNCAHNISNILNSLDVQNQINVEVIIVNDGSNDNTGDIVRDYIRSRDLTNFYIYNYDNAGAAIARERGLCKCIGEYVFFLDSDDIISQDFISTICSEIIKQPDIIYFSSQLVSTQPLGNTILTKVSFKEDAVIHDADKFLSDILLYNNWTSAVWSYVFRRELAVITNAHFTKRIAHEDHIFTLRLIGNAKKIIVLSQVLYFQKITVGSLTNSAKNVDYVIERFKAFEEARDDMHNYFNNRTIQAYEYWSLKSFTQLFFENIKVTWKCFFDFNFYTNFWRYKVILIPLISSIVKRKIQRIL